MTIISASTASPILRALSTRYPQIVMELCAIPVADAKELLARAFASLPADLKPIGIDIEPTEILPIAPKLATLLAMDVYAALADSTVELNQSQSDKWDEISAAFMAPGV